MWRQARIVDTADRYCPRCMDTVNATRRVANHNLHMMLFGVTAALWAPAWIFATIKQGFYCPRCKRKILSLWDRVLTGCLIAAVIAIPILCFFTVVLNSEWRLNRPH